MMVCLSGKVEKGSSKFKVESWSGERQPFDKLRIKGPAPRGMQDEKTVRRDDGIKADERWKEARDEMDEEKHTNPEDPVNPVKKYIKTRSEVRRMMVQDSRVQGVKDSSEKIEESLDKGGKK